MGIAVVGVSTLLAVAAAHLPFLVLESPSRTVPFGGALVTDNLHYGLVATGVLTAVAGLLHALGRPRLGAGLLGAALVAAVLLLLCWISMAPRLRGLTVPDRTLAAALAGQPVRARLGTGFLLSAVASGLLGLLGALNLLGGRPPTETAPPPSRRPRPAHSQR